MRITIEGQPFSQKRHRTNGMRRYDPSAKDKKTIKQQLLPIKPSEPLDGELRVEMVAYFETPKSWSNKKRTEVEEKYRPKSPDVDNIFKIYADAMNGYIYEDDRQVVSTSIEKAYSVNPRIEIEIHELSQAN